MNFRKHYDYDVEEASDEATIKDNGVSLTVQSMAEDADINVLMHRYGITGKMPENPKIPVYADFTGIGDYRSAVESVMLANQGFMELPATVRARFENDPQRLMEFMEDKANFAEAVKLGLCKEPPPPPDAPVNPPKAG